MKNFIFLIILASAFSILGQINLKLGAVKIDDVNFSFDKIISTLGKIFTNFYIILGIIFYVFSMLITVKILSFVNLNIAYPLAVAITFLLIIFGSTILLKELITLYKILGMALIILGIIFILEK